MEESKINKKIYRIETTSSLVNELTTIVYEDHQLKISLVGVKSRKIILILLLLSAIFYLLLADRTFYGEELLFGLPFLILLLPIVIILYFADRYQKGKVSTKFFKSKNETEPLIESDPELSEFQDLVLSLSLKDRSEKSDTFYTIHNFSDDSDIEIVFHQMGEPIFFESEIYSSKYVIEYPYSSHDASKDKLMSYMNRKYILKEYFDLVKEYHRLMKELILKSGNQEIMKIHTKFFQNSPNTYFNTKTKFSVLNNKLPETILQVIAVAIENFIRFQKDIGKPSSSG